MNIIHATIAANLALLITTPQFLAAGERDAGGTPIRISANKNPPQDGPPTISRFLSDRQLKNAPVYTEMGRPLGHIEDFVVDTSNGRIGYAAIGFPDRFEGEKLFAIPIGSMQLDQHDGNLLWRVDVEREKLAAAPGFPRNKWPNIANRRWAEQVDIYFGVIIKEGDLKTDFGTDRKPLVDDVPLQRSSLLIGTPVRGAKDDSCGLVERLIFDRTSGRMRYLAIATESDSTPDASGKKTLCVPMTAAQFIPGKGQNTFVLSLPVSRLKDAPRIQLKRALQADHVDWAAGVDAFYGTPKDKSSKD